MPLSFCVEAVMLVLAHYMFCKEQLCRVGIMKLAERMEKQNTRIPPLVKKDMGLRSNALNQGEASSKRHQETRGGTWRCAC